jgi:N-acyl-D-aspartate/D-glutamate deacylase
MLDLKIINGVIVDGTGRPRFRGDIGVREGRIVAIGHVAESGREIVDAKGLVVAPGFIDCHTHYDAQVFWDPVLSPSCFHGVTTVVGGFCGFSIAPITPDAATYLKPMLARVEGMPLETLETAVPWGSWSSFGEFLAAIEDQVGLNVGFFCGHSALRRVAMGARAVGKRSTAAELAQMKTLLAASLAGGALGFSTTISPTHNDADGNPVPSRWADFSELLALAGVVRDFEGTGLELLPDLEFDPEIIELMADFSIAGQRPVNWNALAVTGRDPVAAAARAHKMLQVSDLARARGGEVIALTIPCAPVIYVNLHNGIGFDSLPGLWRTIFKLPLAERIARFQDPEARRQLAEDAAALPADSPVGYKAKFGDYVVVGAASASTKPLEGRPIREIAAERGCTPLAALLDVAIEDELVTTFAPDTGGEDRAAYDLRGELWRDDRTLIGASDAGAHLDMIDTFAFSTLLLQRGVRDHGVISLEDAIHCITDRIARYFGFIDRGRIEAGYNADLVLLDPERVGRGSTFMRYDVPGGAGRIYAEAEGVPHVFVNGVQIVRDGAHTGALPGRVLRSGKDTRTVPMDALRRAPATSEQAVQHAE